MVLNYTPSILLKCSNDIILLILQYIDSKSCQQLGMTCNTFRIICNQEEIWKYYCHHLWRNVVHNPHSSLSSYYKSLYFRSLLISNCNLICMEDMQFPLWSFRFKEDAGPDWIENDPWHQGKDAMVLKFSPDETVTRYIPFSESLVDDTTVVEKFQSPERSSSYNHQYESKEYVPISPTSFPLHIHWRLHRTREFRKTWKKFYDKLFELCFQLSGKDLCSLEKRLFGVIDDKEVIQDRSRSCGLENIKSNLLYCYADSIKLYIDEIPLPLYRCYRTSNWGYALESCWAFYTSFKMPRQGADLEYEDESMIVSVEDQTLEVDTFNKTMLAWNEAI